VAAVGTARSKKGAVHPVLKKYSISCGVCRVRLEPEGLGIAGLGFMGIKAGILLQARGRRQEGLGALCCGWGIRGCATRVAKCIRAGCAEAEVKQGEEEACLLLYKGRGRLV